MRLSGQRVPRVNEPFVHRTFERHATQHPARAALTCGEVVYSYGDLDAEANRLAHHLVSRGIGRASLVGVCLDRSPQLVIAILAVLKAGAAYVPLDPTYPADRLRLMLDQFADMQLVFAASTTRARVQRASLEILEIDALGDELSVLPTTSPRPDITGQDLCYVVFTSGSTGVPKATAVRHEGWCNLLNWLALEFDLTPESSNLMVSSFGFDISQRSLLTPLFTGATLHLLPSRHFDVMLACRTIRELGIRTLHCAPSSLYLMLDRDASDGTDGLRSIDFVFVGGEPLSGGRVAGWATRPTNRSKLVNVYGVAECTDVSSSHVLADYQHYVLGGVPIGMPIYNVDIHILNDELRPVRRDETGEICISGSGVGAGYLNASAIDEQRFQTVVGDDGEIGVYRTGDLGYVSDAGELMYVGRVDAQVKVRGMRIDLGDVEAAIRADETVHDAVVLSVREERSQEVELVAFVVPSGPPAGAVDGDGFDERALRAAMLASLPEVMVPQRFLVQTGFPLSPNGKIDRNALAMSARQPAPAVGAD
jgi:D-alanine--poly(phosphoribitol) ligase subunit 1